MGFGKEETTFAEKLHFWLDTTAWGVFFVCFFNTVVGVLGGASKKILGKTAIVEDTIEAEEVDVHVGRWDGWGGGAPPERRKHISEGHFSSTTSYSGCVDAENQLTPKKYSICYYSLFSNALKHFDRTPFVCVHFEPQFLDKTKLCQTCLTAGVLVLNTAQFLFSLTHSVLNIFSYIYLHIICMRENDNIYYWFSFYSYLDFWLLSQIHAYPGGGGQRHFRIWPNR